MITYQQTAKNNKMKILVINGHPDEKSYVSALFQEYVAHIDQGKHELEILELGKMSFDPVLRYGYRKRMADNEEIIRSQELLKWADHFVFFYPVWFETVPSLLKGWFERVLTPGIAYNANGYRIEKHLKGKTAHLVSTSMAPKIHQIFRGDIELKTVKRTLAFCGIKVKIVDRLGHYVMGKYESERKRHAFLNHIARRARNL